MISPPVASVLVVKAVAVCGASRNLVSTPRATAVRAMAALLRLKAVNLGCFHMRADRGVSGSVMDAFRFELMVSSVCRSQLAGKEREVCCVQMFFCVALLLSTMRNAVTAGRTFMLIFCC